MRISANASRGETLKAILLIMATTEMPRASYTIFQMAVSFLSDGKGYFERVNLVNMLVASYKLHSSLGYPMEDIESAMHAIANVVGLGDEFGLQICEIKYKNHVEERGKNVHKKA